jgi:AraC-like DNA-binding protein
MRDVGLTRVRSMGPIANAIERAGGSVRRVFRRAELPVAASDEPDLLIPLHDQLRVVEYASREIGDAAFAGRLSLTGGVECLGSFGAHVLAARRLHGAMVRCNQHIGSMLQTTTRMDVIRDGVSVKWTYALTDSVTVGRANNELLALGYMVDLIRHFLGRSWAPMRVELTAPRVDVRSIRELFECDVVQGQSSAAVVFAGSYLAAPNRSVPGSEHAMRGEFPSTPSEVLPPPSDLVRVVEHLVLLGLLDGQRTQRAACRRLGVSVRTLQRRLAEHGATFEQMLASVMLRQATAWLQSRRTITEIAFDFGYSDPAHFTRAFARWTGMSPSAWRRRRFASSLIR